MKSKRLIPMFIVLSLAFGAILPGIEAQAAERFIGWLDQWYEREAYGTANHRKVITGWAHNQNQPRENAVITVAVNELGWEVVDQFETHLNRTDVRDMHGGNLDKGFGWVIPPRFYDGKDYTFTFYASETKESWPRQQIGVIKIPGYDGGLQGSVDAIQGNRIAGWAFDKDGDDVQNQHIPVLVTIDGEFVAAEIADRRRSDVRTFFRNQNVENVGRNHGYEFTLNIPDRFRDNKGHRIHIYGLEVTEGTMTQIGVFDRVIDRDGEIQTY